MHIRKANRISLFCTRQNLIWQALWKESENCLWCFFFFLSENEWCKRHISFPYWKVSLLENLWMMGTFRQSARLKVCQFHSFFTFGTQKIASFLLIKETKGATIANVSNSRPIKCKSSKNRGKRLWRDVKGWIIFSVLLQKKRNRTARRFPWRICVLKIDSRAPMIKQHHFL